MSFWRHSRGARTFLGKLRRDARGNVMAIMAAALIPMIAMIGSGVDMTRAYMAQNRLSQACDAGSLAGRRLLSGTTITPEIRTETTNYFKFNFPQGQFQTAPYTLTITAPQTGTLHVETATTIPTTLMKMFGFNTLHVKASCSATQDFVNTDIMMVYDVSGSMNCVPGDTSGTDCGGVEQTGSKISALRDAATAFYDALQPAQDQLHANNLRLRYGFINYNANVNVGRLVYAKNSSYLVQNWSYWSRHPNWADQATATAALPNKAQCNTAYSLDSYASSYGYTAFMGGWWNLYGRAGCSVMGATNSNPDGLTYQKETVDVRPYLTSSSSKPDNTARIVGTTDGSDDKPYDIDTVWDGCVEERQTNNTAIDGGTATAAPSDAYDLDVDLIPSSDATRWRPSYPRAYYYPDYFPSVVPGYLHSTYQTYYMGRTPLTAGAYTCPPEARRLREYYNDRASFVSYLNNLHPAGSTYHDLGMLWGARFISSTGIFASATPETNDVNDPDNPTKIRGFSVKKYMIFMTDGQMAPTPWVYSAYGVEMLDGRVMGGPSIDQTAQTNRHLQRFRMACNAAKSKGIDIWVIAFGTALTNDLQNCASKTEQASTVADRATLIAKFQEIGSKIGALRLSQ